MKQRTLTESLSINDSNIQVSKQQLEKRRTELQELTIPTPETTQFNAKAWRNFITTVSQYEAKEVRQTYAETLSNKEKTVLRGIEFQHTNQIDIGDLFTIYDENENGKEWLNSKVKTFLREFGQRFVFAPLVAVWVQQVYICDQQSYEKRVQYDSSGYYHPTEHWIAIKYDSGDADSTYWSVEQSHTGQYESSVTLHELGHAVHYLFTAQTVGSESVDNSDRTSQNAVLSYKPMERTRWQEEFCEHAQSGYFNLLDGATTELSLWKQKQTVEEYLAEAFCAYITAPEKLRRDQPGAYKAFKSVCSNASGW